jgi:myosin protein heavy chain
VTDAMAQAQWAEKKWVWVKDKEEGFMSGYIVSENGDTVNIRMSNDTVRTFETNLEYF